MVGRLLLASAFAGLSLTVAVAARATPFTYDLALTGAPFDGTGTLTVDGSLVDAISISIAGQTFTVSDENAPDSTVVQFQQGILKSLTYAGTQPRPNPQTNGDALDLNALEFAFYYNNDQSEESGTLTAQADPIPEPASLALFGIGLAGITVARRRKPRGFHPPGQRSPTSAAG